MIIINKKDGIFWNFAEYLTYIYIVSFPFINYSSFIYSGTSTRSINLIILSSVLIFLFILNHLRNGTSILVPKSPVFLSLAIYFCFVVISGFTGFDSSNTLWSLITRMTGIWYYFNLGIYIYILWGILHNEYRQKKLIFVLIISTVVYSILSLLGPEGFGVIFDGYMSDAFTFGNSTFAGMYLFSVFMLSIYHLYQSDNRKWWQYLLPLLVIINPTIISIPAFLDYSGLFLGEAKASSIVILSSIPLLCLIWLLSSIKDVKKRSIALYSFFSLSLLFVIVLTSSLLSENGLIRNIYMSQSTKARPIVWEISEKIINQSPYLGWGGDNFERLFEINYDNRLLQNSYGGEAWFDKAHNIFLDQLVDGGYLGIIAYFGVYIVSILSLIFTILKSNSKNDKFLAIVLTSYFILHIFELQTAFDTSISYSILAIMFSLSAVLYDRTIESINKKNNEWDLGGSLKNIILLFIFIFLCLSVFVGLIPLIRAQLANGYIRRASLFSDRISEYKILFSSPIDNHTFIWRSVVDIKKSIGNNPDLLNNPEIVKVLREEFLIFEMAYKKYIDNDPKNFRVKLNLADVLIYQKLFGVDKLKEAQDVLDSAIKIVPQAPQTYWMKSVVYLYMKEFNLAKLYAQKGYELNRDIEESRVVIEYINKSIKSFPEIELFTFKQI